MATIDDEVEVTTECPEPEGQEPVEGVTLHAMGYTSEATAHAVMITQTGACPWCGGER
jgi:hypothetical protein